MMIYSYIGLTGFSFLLVLTVGILWEIHEWLMWKYVWKRKQMKPQRKDTTCDFIIDILGAGVFYLFLQA